MPFTKFSNLDYDQIKTSIKDYLRANSTFTDFDFEGSNFSVLIDTLAYNTYITAFNSNMVINESFLDSAVLRENVVSLARNIGYVPRSRTAARAIISFSIPINSQSLTLPDGSTVTEPVTANAILAPGLVAMGSKNQTDFVFSVPELVSTVVESNTTGSYVANFDDVTVYQGIFVEQEFVVNGSLDQRFVLNNSFIDTSTLAVYVNGPSDNSSGTLLKQLGRKYNKIDNIVNVKEKSETYLIQEVQDEKYELLFGDGIFGKKLENNTVITARYIVTDGKDGNGPGGKAGTSGVFTFAGTLKDVLGNNIPISTTPAVTTVQPATNGGDIENIDSVKYFAPRLYAAQHRAVTGRDYESIIPTIYPNAESVSVVGGEELDPPQFGTVLITIKPKNGEYVSDFDKSQILNNLKNYSLTGINQKILDLKMLYVELDSSIYYNSSMVGSVNDLKTKVTSALSTYGKSTQLNKFGGRFKYSKVLNVIDSVDSAITSNITKVRIRRNLKAILNTFAQYELCYGNKFHINSDGMGIKSTGFKISGESDTVYITDTPNKDANGNLDGSNMGTISIVKKDLVNDKTQVVISSAGTVDYSIGEIIIQTINIVSTDKPNDIIEIQAFPESNDVIGLKDLYLEFSISDSAINMVRDTITSGEQISGVGFKVTSSYTNGELTRG
tara:strand:+ start:1135 stop:3141 length:2007 start_codon:yes stop_codon:yes gene_type:complete